MAKLFVVIVIFAFIVLSANGQISFGGLGESKPADNDVDQLVNKFKPDIFKTICDNGKGTCPASDVEITVNHYKTQVIAGINYFISVTVGPETYHVNIVSPFGNPDKLNSVQGPKQLTDEVGFF